MTPAADDNDDGKSGLEKAVDNLAEAFSKLGQPAAETAEEADKMSAFFRAARSGDKNLVRRMVKDGTNPNAYNKKGDTVLHVVTRANMAEMADLLIDLGADPQKGERDRPQHTPMHEAVNFGKPEIAELLARRGGYLPGNRSDGWTLLHSACDRGKTKLVGALLAAGADANELTDNGATPLIISIMRLQPALAEQLLDEPSVVAGISAFTVADENGRKCNAFQLAVEKGQLKIIEKMLQKGISPNICDSEGNTPLLLAVEKGNAELVRALLAAGADVNGGSEKAHRPLYLACQNVIPNRMEIITLLLGHGADPDAPDAKAKGSSAIAAACWGQNGPEIAELLLDYGASVNAPDNDNGYAIYIALERRKTDVLSLLIARGADVNIRHGGDMATPLIAAVQHKNPDAVRMLLAAGADPMLCDREHKSPLFYARDGKYRDDKVIKLLEESLSRKIPSSKAPKNAP